MKSTALYVRRLAASIGAATVLAGCSDTVGVVAGPTPINPLFQSYVALGNSITSGYQSGGINDSTQQESYAALLAAAMHTRYAYPALAFPGCPPPVVNFQTQARLDNATDTTCALRTKASITSALNNVAVPGATSLDPTSVSTSASNTLTTLILGGKTQVERAADAQPTFISAWIGNNDVLPAALTGLLTPSTSPVPSPGITGEVQFEANYRAMLTQLTNIPSLRGGVLIGVIQVAAAPILFPAQALLNPTFKAGFDQYTGKNDTIGTSCTPNTTSLISFEIVSAIRSGALPARIECTQQGNTPLGNVFVLDAQEQTQLAAAVTGYNTFIQSMADSLGWAYYDPNVTLNTAKTDGCLSTVPNLADPFHPFGMCASLDGIHPTALAHQLIANAMIDVINAKYGTALQHVQ